MRAASVKELKQELLNLPPKQILELLLRLTKFKKENKELLTYLLFEAHNEHGFVEGVKQEIDEAFVEIKGTTVYLIKKRLRKILRSITKYSKYVVAPESEIEMLIHFCRNIKSSGIPVKRSTALLNIYNQQLKKIDKLLPLLHEDSLFDYKKQLEELL